MKVTPPQSVFSMPRVLLSALVFLALSLLGSSVFAQSLELPDIQLQRFRPAPGPADYLNVYGTGIPDHLEWDVGFWVDYADNPLQISTREQRYANTVDVQSTLSLIASIGLMDRFELGLLAPLTFLQTSEELQPILPPGSGRTNKLTKTGLNDWRLSAKYQLVDPLKEDFGLALVAALYMPIATQNTLTSDNGFGGELLAAADYWLWRGIRVGANFGYRYRAMHETFRDAVIGDELVWGVATQVPLLHKNLDAILEVDGAISVADKGGRGSLSRGEVPAEIKLAGRLRITDNWTLTAGAGTGLSDGVGTPDYRLFLSIGGYWVYGGKWNIDYRSPAFHGTVKECPDGTTTTSECPELDSDGDGVPDSVDLCPGTPPGTPVDTDGCPLYDDDFDSNLDGDDLPDVNPRCPDKPANYDGFEDKYGCPVKPDQKVVVTEDKIMILDKVHFETAKATILPESHDILNEVADTLEENPEITLLRVEGHTDSRGRRAYNQQLSQDRADSVRDFLVERGIDADRLTAVGYGMDEPIAENETEEGRAENRRVEFTILETASSVDD